ncbi:MAG: DUF541 domain-containing protein [Betaproteobacteria bacterium]|nr:DUF541 domain-containing protein [Betaproteobacteria bacterium]
MLKRRGRAPPGKEHRRAELFNLVSLSAHAEREVANDTLTAVLAADAEGSDPVALAEGVNRTMRDALKLAQSYRGVRARSLNYQTWPVHDKTRIVRWRVRQELRLESREFPETAELIGKLQTGAQANLLVSSISAGLSSQARKQTENALIGEALAAFHARAAIVRDAMQAKGYRVKELQIGAGAVQPRVYASARASMATTASAPPALEAGTSNIQISVSGTVQIE